MVRDFGMSDRFGPVAFGGEPRSRFLDTGMEPEGRAPYSEQTARTIDDEVEKLVKAQDERVRGLLAGRENALRAIAQRLIEVEVIEQDELLRIARAHGVAVASMPPAPPAPESPTASQPG